MKAALKIALSLLVSVILVSGFAVLAFSTLFDRLEARFYVPRVQEAVVSRVDRVGSLVEQVHASNVERFEAVASDPQFRSAFRINSSEAERQRRAELLIALEASVPALDMVRLIDLTATSLHYSSSRDDYTQTGTTRTYLRPDQVSADEPISLLDLAYVPGMRDGSAPLPGQAELDQMIRAGTRVFIEPTHNQLIYRVPATDAQGVLQGSALFYVNANIVRNALLRAGFFGTGDLVRLVQSSGVVDGLGAVIVNLPAIFDDALRAAVVDSWSAVTEQITQSTGLPVRILADSSEQADSPPAVPAYLVFARPIGGISGTSLLYLEPESTMLMPDALRYTILGAVFLTVFLIMFLGLNIRQDAVVVLSDRVRRFQVNLIREYLQSPERADFRTMRFALEDRREDVKAELKRGIGRLRAGEAGKVDELFDREWDEIIRVLGSRAEEAVPRELESERLAAVVDQLALRLQSLPAIRQRSSAQVSPTAPRGRPRPVESERAAAEVDDGELEEIEEIEEAEQVDEVDDGELDEIDEADEAGELDEIDEADEAGQLDEIDEVDEAGELDEAPPLAGELDDLDLALPVGSGELDLADVEELLDGEEAEPLDASEEAEDGEPAPRATELSTTRAAPGAEVRADEPTVGTGTGHPPGGGGEGMFAAFDIDAELDLLTNQAPAGMVDTRGLGPQAEAPVEARAGGAPVSEAPAGEAEPEDDEEPAELVSAVEDEDIEPIEELATEEDAVDELEDGSDEALDELEAAEPDHVVATKAYASTFATGLFSFGRGTVVRPPVAAPPRGPAAVEPARPTPGFAPRRGGVPQAPPDRGVAAALPEGRMSSRPPDEFLRFADIRVGTTQDYEIAPLSDVLERLHVDQSILVEDEGVVRIDRNAYGEPTAEPDEAMRALVDDVVRESEDEPLSGIEQLFGFQSEDLLAGIRPADAPASGMSAERRDSRPSSVIRFVEQGFDYDGLMRGFDATDGGIVKSLVVFTRYWRARAGVLYVEEERELVPQYGLGFDPACQETMTISTSSSLFQNVLSRRLVMLVRRPLSEVEYFHDLCGGEPLRVFTTSLFLPMRFRRKPAYALLALPDAADSLEDAFKPLLRRLTRGSSQSR